MSIPYSTKDQFNKFVLFTNERQIAFLFRDNCTQPYAVRKSGPRLNLEIEYQNHVLAKRLLGERVPEVWGIELLNEKASFYIEYVPEVLLPNIVSRYFFSRKENFIKEILSMINFYFTIFLSFMTNSRAKPVIVKQNTISDLSSAILSQPLTLSVATKFKQSFKATENLVVLPMIQHCDFCVRNILFNHKNKKVLIDWEDMDITAFPLMDYIMFFISIQQVFGELFKCNSKDLYKLTAIKNKKNEIKHALQSKLDLCTKDFNSLAFLSTVSLYHQNLNKNRNATARLIFNELEEQILNTSDLLI